MDGKVGRLRAQIVLDGERLAAVARTYIEVKSDQEGAGGDISNVVVIALVVEIDGPSAGDRILNLWRTGRCKARQLLERERRRLGPMS